jgi:UDP-glucuronate 4-epimerase
MKKKKILVTGSAGFIGFHLVKHLIELGHNVIGLDNINDYYDVNLKFARLKQLGISRTHASKFDFLSKSHLFGDNFLFIRSNLEDSDSLSKLFLSHKFDIVCNLAAQAGVRYSIENPLAYINSNIVGFLNILECCRHNNIKRIVYASSSSVYGNSKQVPFNESNNVDNPISLYAATKKSNELMAHSYSHLYGIETIGLRFFTVYGPWGRPDMACFLFTDAILNNRPINVFNNGKLSRDFTYIDDIVNGVVNTLIEDSKNKNLFKLYNIGNGNPVKLLDFIKIIENKIGFKAIKKMLPMQSGDVNVTYANTMNLKQDYNYKSNVNVEYGIDKFVSWYKSFYNV